MKAHTIYPDGRVTDFDMPKLDSSALRELVLGDIEFVAVLYERKPATLVVNETGAINHDGRAPLEPNARATSIYWTATIKGVTGVPFSPLHDPMVHGVAVLIEEDKRKL